jgi:phosphoglycerate dehydrogenase-like enzyme
MLSRLAPGTLLINPARGSVVDTVALRDLLAARRIFAALDVTDPEPLPSNHPLWTAPGLFLTPHLAGDSHEAEHRIYRLVGEQVRRYVAGGPLLNVVAGGAFPGPYASPTTFSSASSAR